MGKMSRTDRKECVGFCPGVKITVTSGDLSDGDCMQRYSDKYAKTVKVR